jgi:hypothetical protein
VENRTGLLVVRVWTESGLDGPELRARITQTVDVIAGAEVVTAAATPDDVCGAVKEWLEAYLAH